MSSRTEVSKDNVTVHSTLLKKKVQRVREVMQALTYIWQAYCIKKKKRVKGKKREKRKEWVWGMLVTAWWLTIGVVWNTSVAMRSLSLCIGSRHCKWLEATPLIFLRKVERLV